MGLRGPWPALLWGALDGAAGLCAVLLMRRAARGESALGAPAGGLGPGRRIERVQLDPRTRPPRRPGGVRDDAADRGDAVRVLAPGDPAHRWTCGPPAGQLALAASGRADQGLGRLAADETLTAQAATRRVRTESAARRLHELRRLLELQARSSGAGLLITGRVRWAERRAQAGLARVRFTEQGLAAGVLRQAQILTLTSFLATLDYSAAQPAQLALASLIPPAGSELRFPIACNAVVRPPAFLPDLMPGGSGLPGIEPLRLGSGLLRANGHGGAGPLLTDLEMSAPPGSDPLIAAAREVVRQARAQGIRLSQTGLARQLRAQGFTIANERLRWLATASGLDPDEESA